jgi:hypothetical protein
VGPTLGRFAGAEPASGIRFVRFFLLQSAPEPSSTTPAASSSFDIGRPTLTAQCTSDPKAKLRFELFVNFGGVTDTAFYRPWHAAAGENFAPPTEKLTLTLEFLGYTHVKPVKRQFERVAAPAGQLRYNPPGMGSPNLEDISYYLQYLRALPTLRVTAQGRSASFLTTPLLSALHSEPLCAASGL